MEEDEDRDEKAQGYCHFNERGDEGVFRITIFERELELMQAPSSRHIGHGSVVWVSVTLIRSPLMSLVNGS